MQKELFGRLAASWWSTSTSASESGALLLHKMNVLRVQYVLERVRSFAPAGRRVGVVDVGCAGGILTMCLARNDAIARVVGVDVNEEGVRVARDYHQRDLFSPKVSDCEDCV